VPVVPKELSHDELCAIYRKVFSSGLGKTVLEDLRRSYGDRSSFIPGDPYGTHFREGQRGVYLDIIAMIEQDEPTPKSKED